MGASYKIISEITEYQAIEEKAIYVNTIHGGANHKVFAEMIVSLLIEYDKGRELEKAAA